MTGSASGKWLFLPLKSLVSLQALSAWGYSGPAARAGPLFGLTEERQDVLRVAVGDRERLDGQLLLRL